MRAALERFSASATFLDRPRGSKRLDYLGQVLQLIEKHRIDVIHCHGGGCQYWALLCKLVYPHLKLVFTVHDATSLAHLSWIEHWLHRVCFTTIAVSPFVYKQALQLGLKSPRLIENGIPLERFQRAKPVQPSELDAAPTASPIRLICVSRFDAPTKGHDILIDALARLKHAGYDFTCRLVGTIADESPHAYAAMMDQIARLGLSSRVSVLLDCDDVPAQLAQSDVFVLPSRSEGFGLVVVESLAAGLPCVVSAIPGPMDIVRHGVEGLHFASEQPEALCDALIQLIEQPALRAKMAIAGQARSQQFSANAMRAKYEALYQDLGATQLAQPMLWFKTIMASRPTTSRAPNRICTTL